MGNKFTKQAVILPEIVTRYMYHFQQCFGLKFGYWNLITNDTLLWYPLMLPHTRAQNQRDSKRHMFFNDLVHNDEQKWSLKLIYNLRNHLRRV